MNILFLGALFDPNEEQTLMLNSHCGLSNASNSFEWSLIRGLDQITLVSLCSVLPVGCFPKYYRYPLLKSRTWSHHSGVIDYEIGTINLPFLKQGIRTLKLISFLKRKYCTSYNEVLMIYGTYQPFLSAIKYIPKQVKIVLIVADLPEFFDMGVSHSVFYQCLRKINTKLVYDGINRIDAFVLLTEQMKEPLHVGVRPYVVVESICNTDVILPPQPILGKKIILYTGTLHYQFGIKTLLHAFSQIDNLAYELWICGSGEAEKEIHTLSQQDSRIHFYGYVTKQETLRLQQQATLLVNPRTNEGTYTKYSFPSKTIEYMASGIPVLMYKLDGIPAEYDPYLFYIGNDLSKEALCNRIQEICELPVKERTQFGAAARNFVLNEKNARIQTEKIVKMIETLI